MKRILLFTMMCLFGLFSLNAQTTITVGDGADESSWASSNNTPVDVYANYGMSQQIYLADEIASAGGAAGTITQIAFKRAPNSGIPTRNWSIYLTNITEGVFDNEQDWTASSFIVSESDKVYSGNFDIAPDWNVFDLSDFEYTGGNLLVTVVDNTGTNGGDVFWYNHANTSYAIAATGGQFSPENNSYSLSKANRCYIQLTFAEGGEGGETPTPSIAAPQNLVATVNGQNSITVTWDAVEGAEDYYVYKDGQLWANTSGATTYTENGLAAGTECCFAVQAVGAAGESELSAEVCATTESVQLAENEIVIGTATTKYYSPFLTILGGGSWFEAIYKSEEIGKACTISELAFSYKDGNETSADINIYLAETTKDEYANPNDATAESELTLVYSGTAVTLCDEEWETFVLNAPFNYSGENNLVVVVTTANTGLANNWNCYEDANSVLIKDVFLDSKKPVLKLTLGEGGETPDPTPDPEPVAQQYRIKYVTGGTYLNIENNTVHTNGAYGGVGLAAYAESNAQIFTIEDAGNDLVYLRSADGYYIYCQQWNVDAYSTTEKTALGMHDLGDGTFYLMNGTNYFKVGLADGTYDSYYPYCDASLSAAAVWTLEAVDNGEEPEPTVPAAPEVTAEALSATEIFITWDAVDGATSYNIYFNDEVFTTTETEYTVGNLTANTNYVITVTAVNEAGESEHSVKLEVLTFEEEGGDESSFVVEIGADKNPYSTGNYYFPAYDFVAYSFSQQIYHEEEFGGEVGYIQSISFKLGNSRPTATRQYEVYLKETELDAFEGAYIPVTEADKVFDGDVEISGEMDSWYTIELNTPYTYTGSNLVVCVYDKSGAGLGNNYHLFYRYATDSNRGMYSQGAYAYDATTIASGYVMSYVNQIQFGMATPDDSESIEPAVPTNLVATAESYNEISLTWDAAENAEKYAVYQNGVRIGKTTETSYTITGLEQGTEYCFTVSSINGFNESEQSAEACAETEIFDGCFVLFTLTDTYYGYGWYNNYLTVSYDGVSEQLKPTVNYSNNYTQEYIFPIPTDAHVTVTFTGGLGYQGYESYATFYIKYESGEEIFSAPAGTLTAQGFTYEFDVDCSPKAPKAPESLTANPAGESAIVLSWSAANGAESYNVYQGTTVIATGVTGTTYIVEGLNVGTEYCYVVSAVNEIGESEYSEEACATPDYVVVLNNGTESQSSCVPSSIYYNYSYAQQIYTASELNIDSCDITKIAFYQNSAPQHERQWKVYMINTDKEAFTGNTDWVGVTEENLVYEGTVTTTGGGWLELELQNKFQYEGGNILLCVHDNTGAWGSDFYFKVYETMTERALYYRNDDADYAEGTAATLSVKFVNQFRFTYETSSTPSIAAPQNLVATVNGQNSITVTWDAVEGAEDYYVYKDGSMWANTSGATTYTENGLAAGTECCFAVQAVGAAGESELSAEVCATTESVQLAENEIVIGTATTKYYSPFLTILGGGSWFEAIYKSEEIGKACTISELAFSYKDGNETSADINIYLAETTKDEYANPNDATAESELTLVYSGTAVTLCDEEWETFVLNAPFNYSGENNLVVVVTTANTSSANNWNCYEDANTVLIKDVFLDSKKPVLKLTLGEGGEGGDDEPAEITHRLVGIYQNEWNNVAYTYESETSNVVTEVVEGYYKTLLEYNEDGQIVKTTYAWVDPNTGEMDLSQYTLVTYTYADGVLASYKEEIVNPWNPSSTEYTFTYEEDFVVKEWPNAKETYAFEDGRLVEKTRYYYDQWAETPDFVKENMVKYEYDENGNCVTETQYNTYGEEPMPQNGVDYYYDMTIAAENVATFAYPHEFLPAHANLVTKALLYYYQEDWQTHEVSKSNFEVKTYNYSPEVAAAPFAPMELKANVVSDVEISLTWVSIEAAESFNVYCNGELAGNATETYFSVTGLTAATEYCFTVKGVSSGVESEASNEACATTMQLVNIVPNAIAFGDVKMGEFWAENPTGVEVKINLLGKTITSIATDNDFFRVPATINLTEEPVTFKVDYKKGAEAGEYTGNLVVTLSTEETVTIPLSATAYNPVAPDVFELAQEIEFVEGAYTDAPDFATLHDDYNLPNEAEGNNPDAVYTFTLDTESVVNVEVTGENAVYATYKVFGEEEGPTAANVFFGEETILSTSFSYDFESADLSDFTIVDNDEFKDYTWTVENGSLVSYSFVPTPDYSYPYYIANDADERIITNKAYAITANSVLTLDINVNGSGGNFNFGEDVFIEVTQDGETFTQVGVAYDDETTYSYEFMSKRINIGAKFAELGLEYGEYQIVLHHDQTAYGAINVDNLALTERANVYPAGTYYLVAAASSAFEVNVEVATQEMPVAPKAYRLVSAENYEKTTYVYDATDVNRVVKIESEGSVDVLEYNTDGTLAGYKTIVSYEDPELGNVEEELAAVSYVYENGRIVSYSETVQSPAGDTFDVESVITYNAEGQVESIENAAYESVTYYEYNAEGMLAEKVTAYVYGEEVSYDSKGVYTYENGKLVKLEYMYYDWESEEGEWYAVEEYAYTYDANGNCTLESAYQFNEDFETGEVTKSLYHTTEYYYNTEVLADDVYTFEYPHFALLDPAKPATVNALTKDMSYYSYFDEEVGEVVNHTYILTVYNYDPEILSAPYAPFNLTAEATGETTVALTWEAYADAETFVVYNGTEKVAEGIEGFEYTVEGLKAATEYCFTVKAVNAAGESLASNEACATTEESAGPTVPAAPVVTAEVLETTILLTWEAVEGATSYSLYSKGELVKANFPDTAIEVAVPAAGTYCFTVTASNEVGESEHSEEVCATVTVPEDLEVPAAPVVTAKLEGNKAVLSWETVEGALFYTVYYEGQKYGDTQNLSASAELPEFGEYCFTVTATNIAGESEHSNEVCVIYGDGVEENEVAFNIYPNPVENVLFIETEMNVEEVSIYTVTGTLIYKEVDFNSNTIDVSEFNGGVYIMKIRTENGETVKRFVKK